jgi:hypothetical protein
MQPSNFASTAVFPAVSYGWFVIKGLEPCENRIARNQPRQHPILYSGVFPLLRTDEPVY